MGYNVHGPQHLVAFKPSHFEYLKEFSGIVYVIVSVLLSFVSLNIFTSILVTDYIWFNYETTSIPILQNINDYLSLDVNSTIELIKPSMGLLTRSTLTVNPVYPRLIMYEELTTLESAIVGLRNMDIAQVVFIVSPYCWVDLTKQWEMAYTVKRQERCVAHDIDNAAVYFEAILRNIDFASWRDIVQGKFDLLIGNPIAHSGIDGSRWVENLLSHVPGTTEEEVHFWQSFNLKHFTLQYGTGIGIGMDDVMIVQNAFGLNNMLQLKLIPTTVRLAHRTSMIMYNLLYNDLYSVGVNQSLVRNTTNYFGLVNPNCIEANVQEYPLLEMNLVVHNEIGPLGNIDARWIAPPQSLRNAVRTFREELNFALVQNSALLNLFQKITTSQSIKLHPVKWNDPSLEFLGGNFLCNYNKRKAFVQQAFAFDDLCSTQLPLTADWTGYNSIFAYMMSNKLFDTKLCSPAKFGPDRTTCRFVLQWTRDIYVGANLPMPNIDTTSLVPLGYMQFVSNHSNTNIEMQYLLDDDFALFGWMAMYEWAWNEREALWIEGDVNSFHVMSKRYEPISRSLHAPPNAVGLYMLSIATVTSDSLALVATLAIILWCVAPTIRGYWIHYNLVVSSVWLNRNFSLIRGLAAIGCLSSVAIQANTISGIVYLTNNARSLLMSCLLAGESLWFSFVVLDFLLPLSEHFIRFTAPWTTFIAWAIIVAIDQLAPLQVYANLDRQCESYNMDFMVYCTSGILQVGQISRNYTILSIHVLSILIAFLLGWCFISRQSQKSAYGKLIPMSFTAFAAPHCNGNLTKSLSASATIMCGYINYTIRGTHYAFDLKLWRNIKIPNQVGTTLRVMPIEFRQVAPSSHNIDFSYRRRCCVSIEVIAAMGYLFATLCSNVAFVKVVQQSMTNDMGWAGFNSTMTHAMLSTIFNQQLLVNTDERSIDLADSAHGIYLPKLSDILTMYPGAIRRQMYTSAPLDVVITGLRAMNSCLLPSMFTQYCWLDFDRNYEMASTLARQGRCLQNYSMNGAVYLESGLRNLQSWDDWDRCWGTSFSIGISTYLQSTSNGIQWLKEIQANSNSISEEVVYWQSQSITQFILQWQNYKSASFEDKLLVTNAWGKSYPLLLSFSEQTINAHHQTSSRMYWSFANDLWAVSSNTTRINGGSLLRQSSSFAFTNISHQALLFDNDTLTPPLTPGLSLISSLIGPYGDIDMYYVQCPKSLQQFYGAVIEALANLTFRDLDAQAQYLKLPLKTYIGQIPTTILSNLTIQLVGGGVVCGDDIRPISPRLAMAPLFGFENICHLWIPEFFAPPQLEIVFAMLGFHFNHHVRPAEDFHLFCSNDVYAEANCVKIYNSVYDFITKYHSSFEALMQLALATEADVKALDVLLLQLLIANNDTAHVEWFQRNIVDDKHERSWPFFGWCYLYEWIIGRREVVSFHGDHDTYSFISSVLSPLTLPLENDEIPNQLSYICSRCALYVTVFLIAATSITVLYVVVCSGDVEPWNLLEVNRLIGHAWIGRSILIVRSATALWLLNTSQLELMEVGAGVQFTSPPLAWTSVLLASSELLWLVYMCNNVLSFITRQHTLHYATKSTVLTWLSISILSFAAPQTYMASIHRTCEFVNMDCGLVCTSAFLEIGSWSRVQLNIAIVVSCVVGMAVIQYMLQPKLPALEIQTFLLSSTGYYMLDFTNWSDNENEFYLDRASAFLAGLVSIRWRGALYIFDVKSWGFVNYNTNQQSTNRRFAKAISLSVAG